MKILAYLQGCYRTYFGCEKTIVEGDYATKRELVLAHPDRSWCNADLSEIDFRGADLRGFNFNKAFMDGCKFEGAKLNGTTFKYTHLIDTDLSDLELNLYHNIDTEGAYYSDNEKFKHPRQGGRSKELAQHIVREMIERDMLEIVNDTDNYVEYQYKVI